jgi:hypothetical protein
MKKIFIVVLLFASTSSFAQTNTFPVTGNVGIGTTSPSNKLTVEGQIESGPLLLKAWSQSPYANSSWVRGMSDVGVFLTNNNVTRWAGIKADGSFDVSSGMLFADGITGNIGIGTSVPTHKLMISGGGLRWGAHAGANDFAYSGHDANGLYIEQVGDGTSKDKIRIQSSRLNNFSSYSQFFVDPDKGFYFLSSGNASHKVGIGTSTPQYQLHLNGNDPVIQLSSTASEPYAALRGNNDTWLFGYNGQQEAEDISIGTQDGSGQRTMTLAAGGISRMKILANGNIGIGTLNPTEKLAVNGNIRAKKIIISQTGWPDYVFDSSYSLRTLSEVEKFITKNKHLPEIPSAKEVEEKGINVGDHQALLLKKIEELTLYLINLKKENEQQQKEIEKLKQKIK